MENMLQIFENEEYGTIRTIEVDGEIYFVAADVCRVLEIQNVTQAVSRLEEDEKAMFNIGLPGGATNCVNETGLYRLIFASRKPDAKKFQRWVFHEVIPQIRRTGSYSLQKIDYDKIISDPEFYFKVGNLLKAEQEKNSRLTEENAILTQQVFEMAPKAKYYDLILQCPHAIPVTIIAKDYGMSSKKFNQLLNKLGIQYKVDGTWVLYSYYENRGWTTTKTHRFDRLDGTHDSHILTCWTQQGRQGLYELLKLKGYLPLIELNNN